MEAKPSSVTEQSTLSPPVTSWCQFLLEHLEEFSSLAWLLVADGKLVEETFERAMAQFDATPFSGAAPLLVYDQARKIFIAQALAVLEAAHAGDEEKGHARADFLADLSDPPRMAFLLRMVIRSSAKEVAEFLNVAPCEAKDLVCHAINHLSGRPPSLLRSGCLEKLQLDYSQGD